MTTYEVYRRLRLNDLRLEELDAYLDAVSNILDLADALYSNTTIKSVRAHVDDSFSGRPISEVLVFFEALGSRPGLKNLFFGPHRYSQQHAQLNCQALSLSLIQASQLTILELCGLELAGTLSDFQTLGASLQNHPSLQEFRLQDCQLENELRQTYALDPLIQSLSTIKSLEKLSFQSTGNSSLGKLKEETAGLICGSDNNTSKLKAIGLLGFDFDAKHFSAMVPGLSSSTTTVKELYIGKCKLGTTGDLALAQILQHNKSLVYLDIQFEADESPCLIAQALKHNQTLRHLFVHGDITLKSQEEFSQSIKSNYLLDTLELMNGSVFLSDIRFYLRMNVFVRELLLTEKQSSKAQWLSALISQRGDLNALFYLISVNPLLCSAC